jgi:hypothetical protein
MKGTRLIFSWVIIFVFAAKINSIQLAFSHPVQIKVYLSKLATLRQVHCVLTGSVVTHSVLLFLMHQGTIPTIDRTRKPLQREESFTDKGLPRLYRQILT